MQYDIPKDIAGKVSKLLFALHTKESSQSILKGMETAQFYPANDESYAPVRDFIDDFEKDIRPVEQP